MDFVDQTEFTAWIKFDSKKCNLEIPPGKSYTFNYWDEFEHDAIMYLSLLPLEGRPDFRSALFIYEQIEISSYLDHLLAIEGTSYLEWKLSNANFFGLPIQLETTNQIIGFNDNTCRSEVLDALARTTTPFDQFKIPKNHNIIYRWFSPARKDPRNIWRDAIAYGLQNLNDVFFTYETPTQQIICNFYNPTENSVQVAEMHIEESRESRRILKLSNINTFSAIRGTIFPSEVQFEEPQIITESELENINAIQSGAFIAAAINRGVLHDVELWNEEDFLPHSFPYTGNYYQINKHNCGQFNDYAKVIHEQSVNYKGIGFCYDEYFVKNTSIKIPRDLESLAFINIKILPF